ncbi:sulfate transporter [Neisseria weixii]|nr:sulfate transporter [Neisseria weixii]
MPQGRKEKRMTDLSQYRQDAKGNLVALANIKEIDLLRDELVMEIAGKAAAVQSTVADFKRTAMDDIAAFVQLSADRYDVKLGGKKGNITLHSFDGSYRVNLAMQDTLVFDEGLAAAKALIDECINEWTEGSRSELKTLINAAFQVDKEGNISTARVLGLRRLEIKDEKWHRAMDALSDSLQVHISKPFVRVYRRAENGEYALINLDIAKV